MMVLFIEFTKLLMVENGVAGSQLESHLVLRHFSLNQVSLPLIKSLIKFSYLINEQFLFKYVSFFPSSLLHRFKSYFQNENGVIDVLVGQTNGYIAFYSYVFFFISCFNHYLCYLLVVQIQSKPAQMLLLITKRSPSHGILPMMLPKKMTKFGMFPFFLLDFYFLVFLLFI